MQKRVANLWTDRHVDRESLRAALSIQPMINPDVREFSFSNGLTLLVQRMPDVQSAATALMTPAGCIYQPAGCNGVASVLSDLITRGAGSCSSSMACRQIWRAAHLNARPQSCRFIHGS